MYYIGVDLGTSAVKLLLMDETGKVMKIVSKEYPISFPEDGWSEQDPEDWWRQTYSGIKELLNDVDGSLVKGISFGGQMHGLVALDEKDAVIRPAILWNDSRTQKETYFLNNVIGRRRISELTGNIAFAGFTAPKIMWMKENEPENYSRIRRIMLPKDYIAFRLSGVHSTDYSDASGMLLLDVEHRRWSEEMLEICSVKKEWMPSLYESYEVTGRILPELADDLGISPDAVIAAGAGDNAAAAVGTGTVGADRCNLSLGTSGTIFITSNSFGVDPANALHSFAHADGSFHYMGCMLSAASCNNWWVSDILGSGDFMAEQEGIRELGKNKVFFLPYLMGERSPHNDPSARGAFIGMSMDTRREDMTQAVFEGVAFGLRDSLEAARAMGVAPSSTTICGGGAKSDLWKTIVANVMNITVKTVKTEEGPAYGAAILAAVADGAFPNVEDACSNIIEYEEVIEPSEDLVALYHEKYGHFVELYPYLKEFFHFHVK